MSGFAHARPWLTAGVVSAFVVVISGAIFFASTQPTNGSPNPLWQFAVVGILGIFIAVPALTISLVGGAIRVWRRHTLASRVLAGGMLVAALPFLLYSLFLVLAASGVIHVF